MTIFDGLFINWFHREYACTYILLRSVSSNIRGIIKKYSHIHVHICLTKLYLKFTSMEALTKLPFIYLSKNGMNVCSDYFWDSWSRIFTLSWLTTVPSLIPRIIYAKKKEKEEKNIIEIQVNYRLHLQSCFMEVIIIIPPQNSLRITFTAFKGI